MAIDWVPLHRANELHLAGSLSSALKDGFQTSTTKVWCLDSALFLWAMMYNVMATTSLGKHTLAQLLCGIQWATLVAEWSAGDGSKDHPPSCNRRTMRPNTCTNRAL